MCVCLCLSFLVGSGGNAVGALFRVLSFCMLSLFSCFGGFWCQVHHGAVDTLPVIHILSLAPLLLEHLFSLVHCHGVVEVPHSLFAYSLCGRTCCSLVHPIAHGTLCLLSSCHFSLLFCAFCLLFFFLQVVDDAVDGFQAVGLVHHREFQQRVLQMDGICVGYQFVEYLGAFRELFVVGTFLVEQSYCLAVAALGIAIFLLLPVQVAKM